MPPKPGSSSTKGKVIQTVEVVDWEQRRKYIELAVKYAGYYVDKREVEVEQKPMEKWTQQQLIDFILDRLALLPPEALLALTEPPPPSSPPSDGEGSSYCRRFSPPRRCA